MQISKKLRIACSCMVVCAVVFTPVTALAVEGATTDSQQTTKDRIKQEAASRSAEKVKSELNKCQAIGQTVIKVNKQLNERKTKIDNQRVEISSKANQATQERDAELAKKREEWDKKRQENFDKLREKATSQPQKEAVEKYVAAITEAIKVRREANDIAFATFRTDIAELRSQFYNSVEETISTTTSNINQAGVQATEACVGGQSSDNVKKSLKDSINYARESAKQSREAIHNSSQLKDIKTKRDNALKENTEAFINATKLARSELKLSIGD